MTLSLLPLPKQPVSIADILRIVCAGEQIERDVVLSAMRTAPVVNVRHIVMYLARVLTGHSYPEIGRRLGGRDHTTILVAVRKMERRRGANLDLDAKISRYENRIKTHFLVRTEPKFTRRRPVDAAVSAAVEEAGPSPA